MSVQPTHMPYQAIIPTGHRFWEYIQGQHQIQCHNCAQSWSHSSPKYHAQSGPLSSPPHSTPPVTAHTIDARVDVILVSTLLHTPIVITLVQQHTEVCQHGAVLFFLYIVSCPALLASSLSSNNTLGHRKREYTLLLDTARGIYPIGHRHGNTPFFLRQLPNYSSFFCCNITMGHRTRDCTLPWTPQMGIHPLGHRLGNTSTSTYYITLQQHLSFSSAAP